MAVAEYAPEATSLTNLFGVQFSKFLNVAALAVLAFDYCLTFSSEVEYVWGTKWRISRVLFTLARYLGFITSILICHATLFSNDGCYGSFLVTIDVMYNASIIFAEGILILRTYALWGRSKRVLYFLLVLAAAFIAGAKVTSLKLKIILPGDSRSAYQSYTSYCAYGSSRNSAFDCGFLVAYEIILQSMSSWRKFWTYRGLRSRTLNTLYWDGIMYMWWIIVLTGANLAVMVTAPIVFIDAFNTAQVAIHGVLASRIFFNLRECDKQTQSFGEQISLETLHFRARTTVDATTQFTTQTEMVHVA